MLRVEDKDSVLEALQTGKTYRASNSINVHLVVLSAAPLWFKNGKFTYCRVYLLEIVLYNVGIGLFMSVQGIFDTQKVDFG